MGRVVLEQHNSGHGEIRQHNSGHDESGTSDNIDGEVRGVAMPNSPLRLITVTLRKSFGHRD